MEHSCRTEVCESGFDRCWRMSYIMTFSDFTMPAWHKGCMKSVVCNKDSDMCSYWNGLLEDGSSTRLSGCDYDCEDYNAFGRAHANGESWSLMVIGFVAVLAIYNVV